MPDLFETIWLLWSCTVKYETDTYCTFIVIYLDLLNLNFYQHLCGGKKLKVYVIMRDMYTVHWCLHQTVSFFANFFWLTPCPPSEASANCTVIVVCTKMENNRAFKSCESEVFLFSFYIVFTYLLLLCIMILMYSVWCFDIHL